MVTCKTMRSMEYTILVVLPPNFHLEVDVMTTTTMTVTIDVPRLRLIVLGIAFYSKLPDWNPMLNLRIHQLWLRLCP